VLQKAELSASLIQRTTLEAPRDDMYYVGLDVHKKTISYCVKDAAGCVLQEGKIGSSRRELDGLVKAMPQPRTIAMEATIFTGWIYDHLLPHAEAVKVAHPLMLRAISAAKRKTTGLTPAKSLIASGAISFPSAISLQLKFGIGVGCIRPLLQLCREQIDRSIRLDAALLRSLERDPLLAERLQRLRTIPGVGPITALTWALEVGDTSRFHSIKQAISYCGLCGAEKSSADKVQRTPISKQRNKHIQRVLVEAARLAPRFSMELAVLYERERERGNANRATLAVARKLVAYLLAVDRRKTDFIAGIELKRTAAA
jgi:transposase